jgi:hypothetical protein
MKVQTELATRLAGIERALDKGESKKGQNLSAIISAIGIIMSFLLARIIHQPEKSTREGDFVVQMNPKTTVSQAYEAPKTISSGLPDPIHIGRMGATGHTACCQPPRAYLTCLACQPLGSRSTSQCLRS